MWFPVFYEIQENWYPMNNNESTVIENVTKWNVFTVWYIFYILILTQLKFMFSDWKDVLIFSAYNSRCGHYSVLFLWSPPVLQVVCLAVRMSVLFKWILSGHGSFQWIFSYLKLWICLFWNSKFYSKLTFWLYRSSLHEKVILWNKYIII